MSLLRDEHGAPRERKPTSKEEIPAVRDESAERRGLGMLAGSTQQKASAKATPFAAIRSPAVYWPAGATLLVLVAVFAFDHVIGSPSPRIYGEIHVEKAGQRTGASLYPNECHPLDAALGVELSASKNGGLRLRILKDALGGVQAYVTLTEDGRSAHLTPRQCRILKLELGSTTDERASEKGQSGSVYVDCVLPDGRDVRGGATFQYCR